MAIRHFTSLYLSIRARKLLPILAVNYPHIFFYRQYCKIWMDSNSVNFFKTLYSVQAHCLVVSLVSIKMTLRWRPRMIFMCMTFGKVHHILLYKAEHWLSIQLHSHTGPWQYRFCLNTQLHRFWLITNNSRSHQVWEKLGDELVQNKVN